MDVDDPSGRQTEPHPQTLFHLEPADYQTEQAVQNGANKHTSLNRRGKKSLEVGYHVSLYGAGPVIARLGRNSDLNVDPELGDISREHVEFRYERETNLVVLCNRSPDQGSVTLAKSDRINNMPTEQAQREIHKGGVLVVNQEYMIRIASCTFYLVWRIEACDGETKALCVSEYEQSLQKLKRMDPRNWPTEKPISERLTWRNMRSFTSQSREIQELDINRRLLRGGGTFGAVYSTIDRTTGRLCAAKVILSTDDIKRAYSRREITTMKSLNHPNIIQYLGHQEDTNMRAMVTTTTIYMPLCSGSIATLVSQIQPPDLKVICSSILKQMLVALDYLQNKRIIHRDIKPENILFTKVPAGYSKAGEQFLYRLADFGLANHSGVAKTKCGTEPYEAPELRKAETQIDAPQTYKLDVWSLFATTVACLTKFVDFPLPHTRPYIDQVQALRAAIQTYTHLEPMARLHPEFRVSAGRMLLDSYGGDGLTTKAARVPPKPPAGDEERSLALPGSAEEAQPGSAVGSVMVVSDVALAQQQIVTGAESLAVNLGIKHSHRWAGLRRDCAKYKATGAPSSAAGGPKPKEPLRVVDVRRVGNDKVKKPYLVNATRPRPAAWDKKEKAILEIVGMSGPASTSVSPAQDRLKGDAKRKVKGKEPMRMIEGTSKETGVINLPMTKGMNLKKSYNAIAGPSGRKKFP